MAKKASLAVIAAALLVCLAGSALGQGVPYVSGGIGEEEIRDLEARAGEFNLKLIFAAADGKFLADVKLGISGPISLDAVSDGPCSWSSCRPEPTRWSPHPTASPRPKA